MCVAAPSRGRIQVSQGSFASAMGLSASLFLKQTQSLVMTPQLMQSIQLLQMTHFELNQFTAQEVEKNPLLEIASGDAENGTESGFEAEEPFSGDHPVRPEITATTETEWYEHPSSMTAESLGE